MRIHLDLLGGIAADMFVAALLDAFSDRHESALPAINRLFPDQDVRCAVEPCQDAVMTGNCFCVGRPSRWSAALPTHTHGDDAYDRTYHHVLKLCHDNHTHWCDIRGRLTDRRPASVAHDVIGIFQLLADAEGRVHGVPAKAVQFHEVRAWDFVADIVGAAYLIDALDARWTISAVPLGGGRVRTENGMVPVPAPVTLLFEAGRHVDFIRLRAGRKTRA